MPCTPARKLGLFNPDLFTVPRSPFQVSTKVTHEVTFSQHVLSTLFDSTYQVAEITCQAQTVLGASPQACISSKRLVGPQSRLLRHSVCVVGLHSHGCKTTHIASLSVTDLCSNIIRPCYPPVKRRSDAQSMLDPFKSCAAQHAHSRPPSSGILPGLWYGHYGHLKRRNSHARQNVREELSLAQIMGLATIQTQSGGR